MSFDGEIGAGSSATLKAIWEENTAARAALRDEVRGSERYAARLPTGDALLVHRRDSGSPVPGGARDDPEHLASSAARRRPRPDSQSLGPWKRRRTTSIANVYNRPAGAPESVLPSPDRPLERLLAGLDESRERLQEVTRRAEGRVRGERHATAFPARRAELLPVAGRPGGARGETYGTDPPDQDGSGVSEAVTGC